MNRFALLRLPTVALIEVLKCLNPIEFYQLSQCSRKMAQIIPLAGMKKLSLEIDFVDLKIVMNRNYVFRFRNELYYKGRVPNTLVLYFPDDPHTEMIDQLKMKCYYMSALFRCPVKSLTFGQRISMTQCRLIIEKNISKQDGSLENLKIDGVFKDKDLKWILENANVTERLQIWTNKLQNSSIELKLNCRKLFLCPALWVTVDNLVSLTSCVTIQLFETNLTYQDLDIFMKKWKSGSFPNLEYIVVDGNPLKNDGQILGFSKEQLTTGKGYEREKIVDKEYIGTCRRGVDVENDDGMKGSIQMRNSAFELFVWKD